MCVCVVRGVGGADSQQSSEDTKSAVDDALRMNFCGTLEQTAI